MALATSKTQAETRPTSRVSCCLGLLRGDPDGLTGASCSDLLEVTLNTNVQQIAR